MPDAPRCPHCGQALPSIMAQDWQLRGGDMPCMRCGKVIGERLLRGFFG